MKITINVDCTPDEARHFLGLPDVKPMQDAVMAEMERQMLDATKRFSPDALLRSWLSLLPQSPEQMQEVMGRLFGSAFGMTGGGGAKKS
jgi:hypothetical protein